MFTLPPETSICLAWMAPACVWQHRSPAAYIYAEIRSSCISPKPETLNPETESDTSGAGPGPGPLYVPPAAGECETEQTCGLVSANPTANLRRECRLPRPESR